VVELKRASEGSKDRVIPLLSQAALEAVHYSRVIPGHPVPVAIVGANRISDSVAKEAKQFVRERAPEVAIGVLDLEGLRLFAGHGLESLSSTRRPRSDLRPPRVRAPRLFSDLNQWMLKVLLALPVECQSEPSQGDSQIVGHPTVFFLGSYLTIS
jgi:hypothetical protein